MVIHSEDPISIDTKQTKRDFRRLKGEIKRPQGVGGYVSRTADFPVIPSWGALYGSLASLKVFRAVWGMSLAAPRGKPKHLGQW